MTMQSGNGAAMVVASGEKLFSRSDATRAFEPSDIESAYRLAKILVASRLLPRGVGTPEAAFAIIATGRELGLTAMQSLRSIHVIEGKPSLSADLLAGLCKQRTDVCRYFQLVESSATVATYETHRVGEPSPTRMSFTIDDAKQAGVVGKDNWRHYPKAMLRARCITALARAVYPDLTTGIYDPEELGATTPQVVPEIEAPPPVVNDDRAFAELAERIDAAETVSTLNAIAKDVAKAQKAGRLASGPFEAIKTAVVRKRALLQEISTLPIPGAPASEPVAKPPSDVGMAYEDPDAFVGEG